MLKFLPVGFIGLMVGGLIAANSSTILTHLNWGASYLVHDFYRRFLKQDADGKALCPGRAGWPRSACSSPLRRLVFVLETAKDSFDIILQVGAGTGLLYLVRWFWWRVNAWCEVNAMISSFVRLDRSCWSSGSSAIVIPTHYALLITIAFTTVCWVLTAYLGPPDRPQDADRVLQEGPALRAGLEGRPQGSRDHRGRGPRDAREHPAGPRRLGLGSAPTIWSALFTVGNFLYGRWNYAIVLFGVFLASGFVLLKVINRLWPSGKSAAKTTPAAVM